MPSIVVEQAVEISRGSNQDHGFDLDWGVIEALAFRCAAVKALA
jgi:hypothetical protein